MRRLFLSAILVLCIFFGVSAQQKVRCIQDIIVSDSGDSVRCIITRETEDMLFFKFISNGLMFKGGNAPKSETAYSQVGFFKDNCRKELYKTFSDYRVSLNGGGFIPLWGATKFAPMYEILAQYTWLYGRNAVGVDFTHRIGRNSMSEAYGQYNYIFVGLGYTYKFGDYSRKRLLHHYMHFSLGPVFPRVRDSSELNGDPTIGFKLGYSQRYSVWRRIALELKMTMMLALESESKSGSANFSVGFVFGNY